MIITAGKYKGRKIETPGSSITRPTLSQMRMSVFNTLYSLIGNFEGKTFFDVFGGSGIMGLEALSRGFSKVKVCEKNPKAAEIIRRNYEKIGLKADLTLCDSVKYIQKNKEFYDVIYVDPPYFSGIYETVLERLNGNIIIVEHTNNLDFDGYNVLKQKITSGKTTSFIKKFNQQTANNEEKIV